MPDKNRQARYYRLTSAGSKQLMAEESKWERLAQAIAKVMKRRPRRPEMTLWPWRARRAAREQELHREIEWHLNEIREELEAEGLSPRQADHVARREFGNIAMVQEDTRAAWGWTLLEQFAQDLRYALRTMGGNRLFTVLAVASLALGIGANTAIYSFMDALLLRSLPVAEPDRWRCSTGAPRTGTSTSSSCTAVTAAPGASDIGHHQRHVPIRGVRTFQERRFHLLQRVRLFPPIESGPKFEPQVQGQADMASVEYVSGEFFSGLGVPPAAGRLTIPDDDRPGASPWRW